MFDIDILTCQNVKHISSLGGTMDRRDINFLLGVRITKKNMNTLALLNQDVLAAMALNVNARSTCRPNEPMKLIMRKT